MWWVPRRPVVTDTTWGRRPAEPQEAGLQVGLDSTSGVLWLFRRSPGFRAHSDVPAHPALPPTHLLPELEVGLPSSPCSEGMEVLQVPLSPPGLFQAPGPPALETGCRASLPSTAPRSSQHPCQRPTRPDSSPSSGHALDTAVPWGAPWPRPPRQLLSRVRPRLC